MRRITPLHSRLNIIPRADIANAMHNMHVEGGEIDSLIWGRVRVNSPIQYRTPAPRDSFAFGEVASVGLPGEHGARTPSVVVGDIIGFDLWQIGHEVPAEAFYEACRTFYTLPWSHALCRFPAGQLTPIPVGGWLMVEPDEVVANRLLSRSDGTLTLPGSLRGNVGTNSNQQTKVRATVGKVLAVGAQAIGAMSQVGWEPPTGWWALYNPLDSVTIAIPDIGIRAFVRWDDVEQAIDE